MSKAGMFGALVLAAALLGCNAETPAPAPEPASAEPATPEPTRLPVGEITKADVPALMAAVYTDGVPDNVKDIGIVVLGERVVLLTGADSIEPCTDCTGALSLFYLVRTDAGFLLQEHYRDFHKSGRDGKFNREIAIVQFAGLDGRPSYAGFTDVNTLAACDARTLTLIIFTEAGPRTALEAPFGAGSVSAKIIEPAPYQAEFAIEYRSAVDDFVAPYLFVNQKLRQTFPTPEWTRAGC